MRVTTALNRMLRLPGASVIDVSLGAQRDRAVAPPPAGLLDLRAGRGRVHGRWVKRWRHLDLGANRCVIKWELRRLLCPDCGCA